MINKFGISLVCLFLSVVFIIIGITYILYFRPQYTNKKCAIKSDCEINEICNQNECILKNCTNDNDCNGNGLCINSFCIPYKCNISNDCPPLSTCIDNICIVTGNTCISNNDCYKLTCNNNKCIQCQNTTDCINGQGCFNNICRYPNKNESIENYITYISHANTNGNVIAPPAYLCSTSDCTELTHCNSSDECNSNCPYCVNNVCRCVKGSLFENCSSNNDCIFNVCLNHICGNTGAECLYNYGPHDYSCPSTLPYCVNGKCSSSSFGAFCGPPFYPFDICYNPQSLGITGNSNTSNNLIGFYCVNGLCNNIPGSLNDNCSFGSCKHINDSSFRCLPTQNNTFKCINSLFPS